MKLVLKTIMLGLITVCFTQAQTIYKSSIDNGGDNVSVGNNKVLYAIGGTNIREVNVSGLNVSEGFISALPNIEIIITEIMQNPDGVSDANGEYFEVYNPTQHPINLKGWIIKDDIADAAPHIIATDVIVPKDGFVVLARNDNFATNGNVVVDYKYTNTDLADTSDAIIIENAENREIDRTVYDGGSVWPNPVGASMVYIGSNIQDNNDGNLWESAQISEGIFPDYGSPGTNGSNQIVNHLVYANDAWNEIPTPNTGVKNSIVMENESTVFASNVSVLSLKVKEGADITINSGVTVTTPTVTLESTSTSYSSLILDGDVSGDVIYNRHVNATTATAGNDLVTPPVTGEGFDTFIAANPNVVSNGDNTLFLFGPFNKSTGEYELYANTETATLTSGTGYRAGTTDNGNLSFTGTARKGIVSVPIYYSGTSFEQWNLVGNPYASYINVMDFLNHTNNFSLLDANNVGIYGYDGDLSDGWTIYNLNTITPSTLIAPGQGFFVATYTNGNLEFTPSMRRAGNSDDFIAGKNDVENKHLKLRLNKNTSNYSTDFYFNVNSTLGLDLGYDAGLLGDENTAQSFVMYSHLLQDNQGVDFAIQSLPYENLSTMEIPLGIHSNANEQITVSILESNLPASTDVFLEDRLNNTFTLLNQTDFILTPNIDLVDTGRFYLRFSTESLGTNENELENLKIFTTKNPRQITVSGLLREATALALYDVRGRLILSTTLDESQLTNHVDVSAFEDGVYIVKLNSANKTKSQKVIIR